MRIKTILDEIKKFFGYVSKEETIKIVDSLAQVKKNVNAENEKIKHYINYEHTQEEDRRRAKYKELDKRKINFCFIPEQQNSINIRSMLEFIYRELPKKSQYGVKQKLRFYMWSRTREIIQAKQLKIINDVDYYVCEVCGESGKLNQGTKHDVEIHEIWEFVDIKKIKNLKKLYVLLKIFLFDIATLFIYGEC